MSRVPSIRKTNPSTFSMREKLSLIEKRCHQIVSKCLDSVVLAVVVDTWYALTRLYDKLWRALPGCTIVHLVASGIRPRGSKSRIFFWR